MIVDRDTVQLIRIQEKCKELEAQLKDSYKGKIGDTQEVLKLTKENKEVADKNRDVERKLNIC